MKTFISLLLCFFVALPASAQRFIKVAGTTNDLLAQPVPDIHTVTLLRGYASTNENFNGLFQYIRTSTATPDGIRIFTPTFGAGVGRYHLLSSPTIYHTNFVLITTNVTVIVSSNLTLVTTNLTFVTTNTTNFGITFIDATTTNVFYPTNLFLLSASNMVAHADRVSDLVTLPLTIPFATLGGYYQPADGGGGDFMLTNTVTGTNFGTRIASATAGYSWDRIRPSGPLNLRWFGATGTTNQFANTFLTNCIAAATISPVGTGYNSHRGAAVFVPDGTYRLTNVINLPDGIHLSGQSRHGTIFDNTMLTNDVFYLDQPTTGGMSPSFFFENFTIHGTNTAVSAGSGIHISTNFNPTSSYEGTIQNVHIHGHLWHGIKIESGVTVHLNSVRVQACSSHGIWIKTPANNFQLSDCFSILNLGDGFRIESANNIAFIACASDQNEGSGFNIIGAHGVHLVSSSGERNRLDNFTLTSTDGVVMQVYNLIGVLSGAAPRDGIRIDGGKTVIIQNGVTQSSGTAAIGYALNVTNGVGSYPELVTVVGGTWTGGTAGVFNDPGKRMSFHTNMVFNTGQAHFDGLYPQLRLTTTTETNFTGIRLNNSLGPLGRKIELIYVGSNALTTPYNFPLGGAGINAQGDLSFGAGDDEVFRIYTNDNGYFFANLTNGNIISLGVVTAVGKIRSDVFSINTIVGADSSKDLKSVALSGLTFDGTTLSATGGGIGGADTQVQFNDGGVFGGDAGLTYVKATDALTVVGALASATLNTGNGAYELFAMDQNVRTTDDVTFDDITSTGNINLPDTADSANGVVTINSIPAIHFFGTQNTYLGESSGNFASTHAGNTGVGFETLGVITSSQGNVAVGVRALRDLTSGNGNNVAIGNNAANSQTTADRNTVVGAVAGGGLLAAGGSTLIGYDAETLVSTVSNVVVVGATANAGQSSIAIGYDAQANGTNSVAIGEAIANNTDNAAQIGGLGAYGMVLNVNAGQSATTRAKVGGSIFYSTTQLGNGALTETTVFTNIITGATLNANGDSLSFEAAGTFTASASVDKRIRVYFGATLIFDSGNIAVTAANDWGISGTIIRTGAATQKSIVRLNTSFASLSAYADYATPAETLSGSVGLGLTTSGTLASDVVGELWKIRWEPAP